MHSQSAPISIISLLRERSGPIRGVGTRLPVGSRCFPPTRVKGFVAYFAYQYRRPQIEITFLFWEIAFWRLLITGMLAAGQMKMSAETVLCSGRASSDTDKRSLRCLSSCVWEMMNHRRRQIKGLMGGWERVTPCHSAVSDNLTHAVHSDAQKENQSEASHACSP